MRGEVSGAGGGGGFNVVVLGCVCGADLIFKYSGGRQLRDMIAVKPEAVSMLGAVNVMLVYFPDALPLLRLDAVTRDLRRLETHYRQRCLK